MNNLKREGTDEVFSFSSKYNRRHIE